MLERTLPFLRSVYDGLVEHDLKQHAAALAFYALMSLAPISIFLLALSGIFFEQQAAQSEIIEQVRTQLGPRAGDAVKNVLDSVTQGERDPLSSLLGVAAILLGMTAVFVQLQATLNAVFELEPKEDRPLAQVLRKRLLSFLMVVAIGLLLAASLAVGAALSFVRGSLGDLTPDGSSLRTFVSANGVLGFLLLIVLFALIYWILPDAKLDFRAALFGGVVTSLLFTAGRVVVELYLSHSDRASVYGTSGSVVLFLLWIYFSSLIFLVGAEITRVYAERTGKLDGGGKAQGNGAGAA